MSRIRLAVLIALAFLWTSGQSQGPSGAVVRESDLRSPGYAAYQRANELFVAKKFPETLAAVEEALALDPKLVPALTLNAKLAMATNRFDAARQSLEQALAADPNSAYAQFLYGFEAYLTNDLQLALPQLEKARKLSPADSRVALYLGLTKESLGETAEALALYQEAVRLERSNGRVQGSTLLTGSRLLILLDRLDEAERWIRQALDTEPNSRDVHFELARLLLIKGNAAVSAQEGEMALRLSGGDATDAQIHYLLIRAWQQNGDPQRAAVHAAAVRALETTSKK